MIIDAHVHLPVLSETRSFKQAKDELLADMERDGVSYAILIPDNVTPSPIGDVETCLQLVADEPRLFLLGTIDIERQGASWLERLETLLAQRQIVGIKIFPGHDPIYPTDPRLTPVYALCQAYRAPLVVHTGWNSGHPEVAQYNDPKYIVQVAWDYPALKVVIAHYFWPEVDYCYELTHSWPNVYYDIAGLADPEVVATTGADRIRHVLVKTLAGRHDKVILGTDYALCDRQQHLALIEMLPVPASVREDVRWRNAVRLFNLDRVMQQPLERQQSQ
jgi:predicted TIM-barrel fold metal-dependent hydrolase